MTGIGVVVDHGKEKVYKKTRINMIVWSKMWSMKSITSGNRVGSIKEDHMRVWSTEGTSGII